MSLKAEKTCEKCGKVFHRKIYLYADKAYYERLKYFAARRLCSRECSYPDKICLHCQKPFFPKKNEAQSVFRNRKTCGYSCSAIRREQLKRHKSVPAVFCEAAE